MAWNTSTSSRKKYSVVTDKRVTQETRPGKYATMATAPSGTVFAALVLIPMLLLSMVTKPELRWAIWDQPWPAGEWKRELETLRRGCFSNKVLKMRHRCCKHRWRKKRSILQKAAGKALDNIPQNFKDMILKVKTFQQNEKTCYGRC